MTDILIAAAVQLIETSLKAGNYLSKLPFPNDRAHGGMLLCHAKDLQKYLEEIIPDSCLEISTNDEG